MTIRCRSRLSALLFCLPLGLCVAGTAFGASDDDDEDWHDTKGPGGEKLDAAKSKKASDDKADEDKKASDDKADEDKEASDAKANEDKKASDEKASDEDADAKVNAKSKKSAKWKSKDLSSSTKMSFAALGSYGFPNPLAGGLGLRGGAHIAGLLPLYIGGVAEYFFGSKSTQKNFGETSTRTLRLMYFGAELGVEVEPTTDVQLRPFIGLGLGFNKDQTCSNPGGCSGGSDIHATITPGITGLYYLGSLFLGADFRFLIVPGASTASGAIVSGTVGVRF